MARFAMEGKSMGIKPDPEDFERVYREYGRPNPNDIGAVERHYRLAQAAKIMRTYGLNSGLPKLERGTEREKQ